MDSTFQRLGFKQIVRRALVLSIVVIGLAILILIVLFGLNVRSKYSDKIYSEQSAPEKVYGVVLGASVDEKTGAPSALLTDRLDTAIDLLVARKIAGIFLTGDDGRWRSNEMMAMKKYLQAKKIPDELVFTDSGAYRTYDSCFNLHSKHISDVILVTQNFHLPRALYLCNELGVKAIGVSADKHWYLSGIWHWSRDFLASPFAYLDIHGLTLIKKGPAALTP